MHQFWQFAFYYKTSSKNVGKLFLSVLAGCRTVNDCLAVPFRALRENNYRTPSTNEIFTTNKYWTPFLVRRTPASTPALLSALDRRLLHLEEENQVHHCKFIFIENKRQKWEAWAWFTDLAADSQLCRFLFQIQANFATTVQETRKDFYAQEPKLTVSYPVLFWTIHFTTIVNNNRKEPADASHGANDSLLKWNWRFDKLLRIIVWLILCPLLILSSGAANTSSDIQTTYLDRDRDSWS